jgi:adenylate cyclase
VVVLWSPSAVTSTWVLDEAAEGRDLAKLVPVLIEECKPPLGFRQYQTVDLTRWTAPGALPQPLLEAVSKAIANDHNDLPNLAPRVRVSICVLPFANMSGDAEQEYFSDGISEDITTDLSKISALEVVARNTAFSFKGGSDAVEKIAKQLGVSHLLEGSVRKAGNRVRITAQLIDGATGAHVWADRYDRDLTDIFAIQDEISKSIVDALRVKLLPAEKEAVEKRGTSNAEAYNLYLMARQYWIGGNWGDVRQIELVIRICQRAVELDPNYAKAWGLLAVVQSILKFTFGVGQEDGLRAAERALALDPSIAEAYVVRARHSYEHGQTEQVENALDDALRFEPDSWEVNKEAGRIFYFQRRFRDAVRHFEKAVSVAENDYHSWSLLSSAYRELEDEEGVLRAAKMIAEITERVVAQDPTNGSAISGGATAFAILGDFDRVRNWIDKALLVSPDNMIMRHNLACLSAEYLQDAHLALALLKPNFKQMTKSALNATIADPDLDSLREIPEFGEMLREAEARLRVTADVSGAAHQ